MARLLLIEDDLARLELFRVHLEGAGHRVEIAADAVEGIRTILAEAPDLVVSDIDPPYLDAIELIRALRGDPVTSSVPVILLCGPEDGDRTVAARLLGAVEPLERTVQAELLAAAVLSALEDARRVAEEHLLAPHAGPKGPDFTPTQL